MGPIRNVRNIPMRLAAGHATSSSTGWRRAEGKDNVAQKIEKQQKLNYEEEDCLAMAWLKFHTRGQLLHLDMLRYVVQCIGEWRQPPVVLTFEKGWPRDFVKRHPLFIDKSVKLGRPQIARDKERFADQDLLVAEVKYQLDLCQEQAISNENIWRVIINTVSVAECPLNINRLDAADVGPRNARSKETERITAVECINKAGKALDPLILWPDATYAGVVANSPSGSGWKHARWGTGYYDAKMRYQWLQDVFNTATLSTESPGSRVLLVDAWAEYHNDSIEFCSDNDIKIVPAHSTEGLSHWRLQPITSDLRKAFSDAAEMLHAEEGKDLGREDFVRLYRLARAAWGYPELDNISEPGEFSFLWEDIATPTDQAKRAKEDPMQEWSYTAQKCTGSGSLYDRILMNPAFPALPDTMRKDIKEFAMAASEAVKCHGARGCVH